MLNFTENLFSNEDYTEQTEDRVSAEKLQQLGTDNFNIVLLSKYCESSSLKPLCQMNRN